MLYYIVLYYIMLCYMILYYIILYYIILYYIILYYIILYYIILDDTYHSTGGSDTAAYATVPRADVSMTYCLFLRMGRQAGPLWWGQAW